MYGRRVTADSNNNIIIKSGAGMVLRKWLYCAYSKSVDVAVACFIDGCGIGAFLFDRFLGGSRDTLLFSCSCVCTLYRSLCLSSSPSAVVPEHLTQWLLHGQQPIETSDIRLREPP